MRAAWNPHIQAALLTVLRGSCVVRSGHLLRASKIGQRSSEFAMEIYWNPWKMDEHGAFLDDKHGTGSLLDAKP